NLGIRLLHAKPYAAWSKGKIERCFYTLQQGFESTLALPDNHAFSLADLNEKLSRWIQTVYHLRPHSSTRISPQLRFAQAADTLRTHGAHKPSLSATSPKANCSAPHRLIKPRRCLTRAPRCVASCSLAVKTASANPLWPDVGCARWNPKLIFHSALPKLH